VTGYFRVRIRGVGQAFVDSETIAAAPPLYLPFLNVTTIRVAFLPARSRFRAVPPRLDLQRPTACWRHNGRSRSTSLRADPSVGQIVALRWSAPVGMTELRRRS